MEELRVSNGDITLRVEITGDGPTVLCVSGWPELASSWHNQVEFLSSHGYRVAALDVREYGGSSAPTEVERYTLRELAGDVAAVAAELSDEPVVLIGHDWGAPIVWNTAIRHPDRVRAVAGLSVTHLPATGMSLIDVADQLYAGRFFYILYFIRPGAPEADFSADLRGALKRVFYALSGDAPLNSWLPDAPREATLLPLLPDPPDGPLSFITDTDLDALAASFERTGMVGAFNRYRALGLDAVESTDIIGAPVTQPSCFIAGERDPVRRFIPGIDSFADPGAACTDFRGGTIVPGAGHWVHQEMPAETNAALLAFLQSLE
ncbi:alpha/beta fold hydrolase [Mycolicibacterium moriokaense]|nr:alpha/beta fold hydrolase [Mycolicibacterium moriokaense]